MKRTFAPACAMVIIEAMLSLQGAGAAETGNGERELRERRRGGACRRG